MIEKRGAQRHSMIIGSSTHNQRIERLWWDTHRVMTILYYKMFYFMEHHGLLDCLNEHHLWALNYVYLPRILKSLQEFFNAWNSHPMCTSNHKSPIQLFTAGMLLLQNSQLSTLDFLSMLMSCMVLALMVLCLQTGSGIEYVPQSSLHFLDRDIQILKQTIDPCAPSDNHDIELYKQTLHYIMNLNTI